MKPSKAVCESLTNRITRTKYTLMSSVVCTLFESHYHFGLAALTNSLYHNGFRGCIYAGYKGLLPLWAFKAEENKFLNWNGAKTFEVAKNLHIHFLPLDTDFHLTNYKPSFMLELAEGHAKDADGIIYFDPDIVVKCKWQFFEKWISYGVALVQEISNDPMPSSHPIRLGWEDVIEKSNRRTTRMLDHYYNGGFCGVSNKNIEFIKLWKEIIIIARKYYNFKPTEFVTSSERTYLFQAADQDALNITIMCSECLISEIGPDGMDFLPGGWIMSHAVGSPKPWEKKFLINSLKGFRPSNADRGFWSYAKGPIVTFSSNRIKRKKMAMQLSALIGRFYRRT